MAQDRNTRKTKNTEYEDVYKNNKGFPMSNIDGNTTYEKYDDNESFVGDFPEPKEDGSGRGKGKMKKDGTGKGSGRGKADLQANLKKSGLASAMKPDGTKGKSFMDRLKALGYTK